jgi:hypothetical protein
MSVANGTYFIYARRQGLYLQFTDSLPGMKLTIWQFTGDAEQQVRFANVSRWSEGLAG